jgi:phage baseplate assembly protein V
MIEQIQRAFEPLRRRIIGMIGRGEIKATDDSKGRQLIDLDLATGGGPVSKIERIQQYGFTSRPQPGAEAAVVFLGANREAGLVIATEDARYRLKNLAAGEVALYTDEGDKIHLKRGRIIEITTQTLKVNAGAKVEITSPEVQVICDTAVVQASTKADVESPLINLMASTKVSAQTPLLEVSGLLTCGGIAAGGGVAENGKVKVSGNIEVGGDVDSAGNVKDSDGTMAEMRGTYNTHTHPENGTGGGTTSAPNQPMT